MMSIKALKETLKSFLRFLYFGLLGLVGTFITSLMTSSDLQNTVITIGDTYLPVGVVIVAALTGLVKLIDRYVRENENNSLNGIAPNFLQR
jgi:FtsH-binding integral membrane protein